MERRHRAWIAALLLSTPLTLLVIDTACWRTSAGPPPHQRVAGVFRPVRQTLPGTAAIIVSGPISPAKNHARYWNNASLMFSTLKAVGFERVSVLQSDGSSPAPDRQARSFLGMFGTGRLVDSPRDLDGDGTEDVNGPGTIGALGAALVDAGRAVGPGGRILLVMIGHGQLRVRGGISSVAMMWDGAELRGDELNRLLRASVPDACWVAVVATQCHSQLFLDEVTRPRSVLIASGRPLWIWSTVEYGVFPYHLAGALLGRNPKTGVARPEGAWATLRDAVRAAASRDHTPEWPRTRVIGDESVVPAPF
jgi:hypothetical protein